MCMSHVVRAKVEREQAVRFTNMEKEMERDRTKFKEEKERTQVSCTAVRTYKTVPGKSTNPGQHTF